MKRYLLIVLAVILLSCFLISCNPEAEDVKRIDPAIVGTWTCTSGDFTWNLTLNDDGTYIMDETDDEGYPSQTHKGTYSADGAKWVGTVTNILEFFPLDTYTSEHPNYAFKDADETHWKLGFSEECEDPLYYTTKSKALSRSVPHTGSTSLELRHMSTIRPTSQRTNRTMRCIKWR